MEGPFNLEKSDGCNILKKGLRRGVGHFLLRKKQKPFAIGHAFLVVAFLQKSVALAWPNQKYPCISMISFCKETADKALFFPFL